MSKNQTYIAIGLEDLTTAPLKRLFGNMFSLGKATDKVKDGFRLFGRQSSDETKKLDRTIVELQQELDKLRQKRLFERDIENVKKINSEINRTENELKKLQTAGDKSDNIFGKIVGRSFQFNQLRDAIIGIADGLKSLTAPSESFEFAMAKVQTMANLSASEFEVMNSQVKELAKTIPITRDELGEGLYQVISAGVPEDNWLTFLEQSSKSSIGGVADLSDVVKVTSTVIKNYGLEWENAMDIQDKIQKTVQLGSTNFQEMAQALPSVTGYASTLKVGIDELMGAFATLTQLANLLL